MRITRTSSDFEIKPLTAPFGFKGKYVSGLWHVSVSVFDGEAEGKGSGIQSTLWSDGDVFSKNSFSGGNANMYSITCRALQMLEGCSFASPLEAEEALLPELLEYARSVTACEKVRTTFVLNALVPVDYALWDLYAKENSCRTFDDIVPAFARAALSYRCEKLLRIPLVTYGLGEKEIRALISDDNYFLKIKIGSDPDKDGDPLKMLAWDKARLETVHDAARGVFSPYSVDGHVKYYLDANGRYPSKELFSEFLSHADKIGALDRIIFVEEPFDESDMTDVSDLPVRIAADESAHSLEDVKKRVSLGYGAVALKPIAKTQSESFRIAAFAHSAGIPVFCADLTVTPELVRLNKAFASRLEMLPGMKAGVFESNGHQNYPDWKEMTLQLGSGKYDTMSRGAYTLDGGYYTQRMF